MNKTYQNRMLSIVYLVKPYIHRQSPNFEIGLLAGRNLK